MKNFSSSAVVIGSLRVKAMLPIAPQKLFSRGYITNIEFFSS